jgi:DNA invertase Pin-like site-specific DNA recombinase
MAFTVNLMNSRVKFVIADFPAANEFTIHVFAALAQYERILISQRTKAALARSTKPKGVKGTENLEASAEDGRLHGQIANMVKADEFVRDVGETIQEYKQQGLNLKEIAARLNKENVLTASDSRKEAKYKKGVGGKPTGLQWTPTAVRRIQKRLEHIG